MGLNIEELVTERGLKLLIARNSSYHSYSGKGGPRYSRKTGWGIGSGGGGGGGGRRAAAKSSKAKRPKQFDYLPAVKRELRDLICTNKYANCGRSCDCVSLSDPVLAARSKLA
jgi:hypothetical protein